MSNEVCCCFDLTLRPPINYLWLCERVHMAKDFKRVKVTTVDIILFDTVKPCLTHSLTVQLIGHFF